MDPPDDPTLRARPARPQADARVVHRDDAHDDDAWAYEMKWDGMRAIVVVEGGRVQRDLPAGQRRDAALPRARGARRARSAAPRPCSTARSSPSTTTAARASSGCSRACRPGSATGSASSMESHARGVHVLRPALARRPLRDGPAVHRSARAPRAPRLRARRGRPRRRRSARARQAMDAAEALGFEGIVMKRLDSTYQPGQAHRRVAQAQDRAGPGVRGRRLAAGQGRPHRPARLPARRLLRRRRRVPVRGRVGSGSTPPHATTSNDASPSSRGSRARSSTRRASPIRTGSRRSSWWK